MRRKTEKGKNQSTEKVDRPKRRSTRNRKYSSSSDSEGPVEAKTIAEMPESVATETLPVNEDPVASQEGLSDDKQDQVWQVKSSDASDDGEIKKLKICLTTRPPSTPERIEQSPQKKKHHRSRSDTTSSEGGDEKQKIHRHKGKKSSKDSKDDDLDKSHESQNDDETEIRRETEEVAAEDEKSNTALLRTDTDQKIEINKCKDIEDDVETTEKVRNEVKGVESKNDENESDVVIVACRGDVSDERKSVDENKSSQSDRLQEEIKEKSMEVEPEGEKAEKSIVGKKRKPDEIMTKEKVDKSKGLAKSEGKNHVQGTGEESPANDTLEINHKVDELEIEEKVSEIEKEPVEKEPEEPPLIPIVVSRKRRWGTKTSNNSQSTVSISTDSLKNIISDPVKPVEISEVLEEKQKERERHSKYRDKMERPVLPKIVIDNTKNSSSKVGSEASKENVSNHRKISIMKEDDLPINRPPSPSRNKISSVLYITNLVRPFTLTQLKNLLQRTGKIVDDGFWIDTIKSKCYVQYENDDQAVETRHALHGVTWPVSNPKTLNVDFSSVEALEKAKASESQTPVDPNKTVGTVEDWLREQDAKRDRFIEKEEKPWDRKGVLREWDVGKGEKDKERIRERFNDRRRRSVELSPQPVRKFKKKEEEAPPKLLDDLFRKTKATPCIYWLPLSEETIAIKEEQRRKHMEEHQKRMADMRHRRRH